jgi:hypothetical protein
MREDLTGAPAAGSCNGFLAVATGELVMRLRGDATNPMVREGRQTAVIEACEGGMIMYL